jgi:hypothetical protein
VRKTPKNHTQALIIVHLGSLDVYVDAYGEDEGYKIADRIIEATLSHDGPVVFVDELWPITGSPDTGPRYRIYQEAMLPMAESGKASIIQHCEDDSAPKNELGYPACHSWGSLVKKLSTMFRRMGVASVTIGGFWHDPEHNSGCALYLGEQLANTFSVKFDKSILGHYMNYGPTRNTGPQLALDLEEPPTPPATLYHGTTRRAARKIKQVGMLIPMIGSFVEEAYGGEYAEFSEEEIEQELGGVVFAAGFENIDSAITAMISHIASDRGKYFHDVTRQDIEKYGALVLFEIEDPDEDIVEGAGSDGSPVDTWVHRPEDDENYYGQYPSSVEPGDYFFKCDSFDGVGFDEILTGKKLVQFLAGVSFWYMEHVS